MSSTHSPNHLLTHSPSGDGHMEVIVAVSYYFDQVHYEGADLDFDPSLYVVLTHLPT